MNIFTATTDDNISKIRTFIKSDPYCTYDEIEAEFQISRGTIHNIIHDCLKLKKISSRWIPHELTEQNRKERVRICKQNLEKFKSNKWRLCDVVTGDECWFYHRHIGKKQSTQSWVGEGENPRTVVRRQQNEPKTMFCIFFKTTGPVIVRHFEQGVTINNKTFKSNCLYPLVNALNKQRPTSGTKNIKIHYDNARPHIHFSVKKYIKSKQLIIMDHSPYSPDLAPSDFWLFDYIKERLTSNPDAKSLMKQITGIVNSIPKKEENDKTFQKWIERMELCIQNNGDYFEHLIK